MADEGLFYHPEVDGTKCVDCGVCVKACPVMTPMQQCTVRSAWAGVNKNPDTVKKSSSGGVFSALARVILEKGGTVFGACYSADYREVILTGTHRVPLEALRKSKYVESRSADAFREAEMLLKQGKPVLFCGAPCQIAGLKRYLGVDYENLLTCDFTCGGMPSHKIYQAYLEELEKRFHSEPALVDFRPKTVGWENYAIKIVFSNGKKYHKLAKLDPYVYSFLYGHSSVKELCQECPFADNHSADIILADFWKHRDFPGWEKPGNGISLVLTTTERGDAFLQEIADTVILKPLDLEKAAYNIQKPHPTEEAKHRRTAFLTKCAEKGIWAAAKSIGMPTGIQTIKIRGKVYLRYLWECVR